MSSVSAFLILADIPDDLYCSAATATGSWIFCWWRKKEYSRMIEYSRKNNYYDEKCILSKITNSCLECMFPCIEWQLNL